MLSDHLTPAALFSCCPQSFPAQERMPFQRVSSSHQWSKHWNFSFGIISGPLNEATRRSFQKVINSLPCFSNGLLRFFLRRLDTKGR